MCDHNTTNPAQGVTTVKSARGPECHAASYYCAKCVNGARRVQVNSDLLAFWLAQGIVRTSCPRNSACPAFERYGKCAAGMHARDMVNGGGAWLPMAGQGNTGRADTAELSHIVSANNGGAYCPCNLLPETGATNAARSDANVASLSPSARAVLAAWPAYWTANVARKASLARLA